jgi:MFS family permease
LVLELSRAEHPGNLQAAGFYLGLMALVGQAPALVLMPVSGVWADRWDRRRLIRLTQAAAMVQSLALLFVVWAHLATIGGLIALSLVLGSITAVAAPAMQGIVADLVGHPPSLPRAIAISSSISAGARLLGPALGAGLLWAAGPEICFLANAVSFVPLLMVLPHLNVRTRPGGADVHRPWFREWLAAASYVAGRRSLRTVLAAVTGTCFFGMSFYVLLPLIAAERLSGDEATYGMIVTSVGLGGALGMVLLVCRSRPHELAGWIAVAAWTMIAAIVGTAVSSSREPTVLWLGLAGFAVVLLVGGGNVLLHAAVDDAMRGRVTSFFLLAFTGLTPVGGWLAGMIAGHFGLSTALASGAAGMLWVAIQYTRRMKFLRRELSAG